MTATYRGDPEEVSHDPERHKRPSDDTRRVQVQADALLAPAPNRDNLSDVYFIGESSAGRLGAAVSVLLCAEVSRTRASRIEDRHTTGQLEIFLVCCGRERDVLLLFLPEIKQYPQLVSLMFPIVGCGPTTTKTPTAPVRRRVQTCRSECVWALFTSVRR